jgi:hypothetical protein
VVTAVKWTKELLGFLKSHRNKLKSDQIAERLRLPLADVEKKLWRLDQAARRRPPRTRDPQRIQRIAREAAKVINTPGFALWYDLKRCDGAPAFPHFWGYVQRSLTYDVPGRELGGILYEATAKAFESFDASKGWASTPTEERFMTHWRYCFANLAKKCLKRSGAKTLLKEPANDSSEPFRELLLRMVGKLVEGLPEDERFLIRQHYWEGKDLRSIARLIGRRKQFVIDKHKEIIAKLRGRL